MVTGRCVSLAPFPLVPHALSACRLESLRRGLDSTQETERGYYYRDDPLESITACAVDDPHSSTSCDLEATASSRSPVKRSSIDVAVTRAEAEPKVRNGVLYGEGDGTVPLLSLGAMCVEGWKRERYNPAGIEVVTHELEHNPTAFDPRGALFPSRVSFFLFRGFGSSVCRISSS